MKFPPKHSSSSAWSVIANSSTVMSLNLYHRPWWGFVVGLPLKIIGHIIQRPISTTSSASHKDQGSLPVVVAQYKHFSNKPKSGVFSRSNTVSGRSRVNDWYQWMDNSNMMRVSEIAWKRVFFYLSCSFTSEWDNNATEYNAIKSQLYVGEL